MKIGLVYSNSIGDIGWYLNRALNKFNEPYIFHFDFGGPTSKFNYLLNKYTTGHTHTFDFLNSSKFKMDLLICTEPPGMPKLKNINKIKCPKILWASDVHIPLKLNYLLKIAPNFDHVFVCQKDFVKQFKEKGVDASWLPHACDPKIHYPMKLSKKVKDFVFIGKVDNKIYNQRAECINHIQKTRTIELLNNKYLNELSEAYSNGKYAINRSLNGDLNMRIFESLSCEKLLFTDKIENGLEELFEKDTFLIKYSNFDELDSKINYYIDNPLKASKIAKNGLKEVRKKHTYYNRAKTILKTQRLL